MYPVTSSLAILLLLLGGTRAYAARDYAALDAAAGKALFERNWISAPASTASSDGLGPYYNARSCAACHPGGGGSSARSHMNLVIADPVYGRLLQTRAVAGLAAEALIEISDLSVSNEHLPGLSLVLRKPVAAATPPSGKLHSAISLRRAPSLLGLAYLEQVAPAQLHALADPDDANGDGISGRVAGVAPGTQRVRESAGASATEAARENAGGPGDNVDGRTGKAGGTSAGIDGHTSSADEHPDAAEAHTDIADGRTSIAEGHTGVAGGRTDTAEGHTVSAAGALDDSGATGRFGWKAETTSLRAQTARALALDLGLGNPLLPAAAGDCTALQLACHAAAHPEREPEVSALALDLILAYLTALPVPPSPAPDDNEALAMFSAIGCAACHVIQLDSGLGQIRPFTDLLLHDMGPGLADGPAGLSAAAAEWRTAPLWGLRQTDRYLHDGRAATLAEAALWHGGEAAASVAAYRALSVEQRQLLHRWLLGL